MGHDYGNKPEATSRPIPEAPRESRNLLGENVLHLVLVEWSKISLPRITITPRHGRTDGRGREVRPSFCPLRSDLIKGGE